MKAMCAYSALPRSLNEHTYCQWLSPTGCYFYFLLFKKIAYHEWRTKKRFQIKCRWMENISSLGWVTGLDQSPTPKSALPDAASVLTGDLREDGLQDLPWSPKWNPEQQLLLTIPSWNALVMAALSLVKAPTPITQRTWLFIMLTPQRLAAPFPKRLTRFKSCFGREMQMLDLFLQNTLVCLSWAPVGYFSFITDSDLQHKQQQSGQVLDQHCKA